MLEYIISTVIGIGAGCWLGWVIAKNKVKKYERKLEQEMKLTITPEQFEKDKEDDNKFWKFKKEVEDDRKRKYRTGRCEEDVSRPTGNESRLNGEESESRSITSGEQRESISDNDVEQSESTGETTQLHSVSAI